MRLEHVNMTVSDLDRSIRFYGELLGYDVRWRGETANGQPAAHVGDASFYLALFQAKRGGRFDRDYDDVGLNHVGFVVEDLEEMKHRLARAGVTPHAEMDYEPGRRLYFCDADGFEIELVEY